MDFHASCSGVYHFSPLCNLSLARVDLLFALGRSLRCAADEWLSRHDRPDHLALPSEDAASLRLAEGATVFLDAPIDASPSLRGFAYTCPTSQVFAFSAICPKFVPRDNYFLVTSAVTLLFRPAGRRPEGRDLKEMLAQSNPEMTGAVADEARKIAFRVPATHASPTDRHCISNRHSCRLETTLNPCASMAAPFLVVTQSPPFCARPRPACPTGKHTGLVTSDFSNRNIPVLEDPQVHENKG
jgi:hypothetical protein